jgi:hypothetical protein
VRVKITKVGKTRAFPLMSYVDENTGVRVWTNDMVGREMYVDKTTLEDLITYQKVKFEVLEGVYYDEGRNYKI